MRFMTGFLGVFLLSCSGPNGFTSKTDSSARKGDNAADAAGRADGQRSEASNEAASDSASATAENTADGTKGVLTPNNDTAKKPDAKSTASVSSGIIPICIWPPNKEPIPIALAPLSKLKIDQCQVTVKTREGVSLTPDAAKDKVLDSKTLVNIDLKTLIVSYTADRGGDETSGQISRYYETAITCKDQAAVKLVVFVPHSMEGVKEVCRTVKSDNEKVSYGDDYKDK